MKNKQRKLIVYEDVNGKELCREWDPMFLPDVGDSVWLDSFSLSNTGNNHNNDNKWFLVEGRFFIAIM